MKAFILSIFSLYQFSAFVQEVEYMPIFIDNCSKEIKADWWYIIDQDKNKFLLDSGKMKLELNENYFLITGVLHSEPTIINLSVDEISLDTFLITSIQIKYPNHYFTWNPNYYSCGSLINGHYSEFYYNGNTRFEGNFENGKVLDTLKEYFRTGEINSIKIVNGRQMIFNDFYKSGQIRTAVDTKRKFRHYYYESGSLSLKMNNKKHQLIEYYENGTIRAIVESKEEHLFYKNGNLKSHLRKYRSNFRNLFKRKKNKLDVLYIWTDYDSLGIKTREIAFSSPSYYSLYTGTIFQFSKNNYSWIEYYLENQKRIIITKDYCFEESVYDKDCWAIYSVESGEIIFKEYYSLDEIEGLLKKYDAEFKNIENK